MRGRRIRTTRRRTTVMLITISQLKEKAELINGIDSTINDKLSYAIKKNGQRINAALKKLTAEFQEKINDINIDHAAADDRGVLLVDDKGNYKYKPEQAKKRLKSIREATDEFDKKEIEIDFFPAPECPRMADLDYFVIEELAGILFAPVDDTIISD